MELTNKSDINFVIKAAKSASKLIMEYYNNSLDLDIESKIDNSPVTIADKKSSDLIIKQLHVLNSRIPVISEENPAKENLEIIKKHKTYWLIDPIDGTWSFIKKAGNFTVNIGLVKNGVPIWGLIVSPIEDDAVYFIDHKSVACKEVKGRIKKIHPSKPPIKGFDFLVSNRDLNQNAQDFISKFAINTITPIKSSIKMAYIAEGIGHIYPRFKQTCIWDTAAGHALLKSVGGEVYNANGFEPLTYNDTKTLYNPDFIAVSDVKIKELFKVK
jgi:3'(2'), 5'-bisphosphate nucleotidase